MRVGPGTLLAHYEVVSLLGKGGMGEVWRAKDKKLGRDVAIKFLPAEVTNDPKRRARLEREARVLASIDHPGIATLHGLEDVDGVRFLVMQLVDGEDLSASLRKGPIPLRDAVAIAIQIAEALASAHAQGIIHRDLKPANIKIDDRGRIKVLDFGLARAADPVEPDDDISGRDTLSRPTSTVDVVVGTAAYMSPEQARGLAVDRRTDIWSFAVVLFELITGRRLFLGETASDSMAAVLLREVDWSLLPPNIPPAVERVLRRCLQRNARDRMHDMGDVRLELESAFDSNETIAERREGSRPRFVWPLMALAAGIVAGALALTFLRPGEPPPRSVARWVEIEAPHGRFAHHPAPEISPQGDRIAYWAPDDSGRVGLWVRSLDLPEARLLPGTSGENHVPGIPPFWSPDGESIGFFSEDKLIRVDLKGGPPLELAEAPNPRGGSWSADGTIIYAPASGEPVYRIPATGGEATPIRFASGHRIVEWPHFLPDGRHFLVTFLPGEDDPESGGVLVSTLDGQDVRVVSRFESRMQFAKGFAFFGDKGSLFVQPFDLDALELRGEPKRVAGDLGFSAGDLSSYAFSISPVGNLVYWGGRSQPLTQLRWYGRSGELLGTVGDPAENIGLGLSKSGRMCVVERHDPRVDEINLWLVEMETGVASKLSSGISGQKWKTGTPVWTPDEERVLFVAFPGVAAQSLRGGKPERLFDDNGWLSDVSPDGRGAIMMKNNPESAIDLWILPLDGEGAPRPLIETRNVEMSGHFSPDGRWLVYVSDEAGERDIYVRSYPQLDRPVRISPAGGDWPEWSRDGKELYYIAPDRFLMSVAVDGSGSAFRHSSPTRLFEVNAADDQGRRQLAPGRDGSRFLINARVEEDFPRTVRLLLGWDAAYAMK